MATTCEIFVAVLPPMTVSAVDIPDTVEPLQSPLAVIALQLIAYLAAVLRGCNVDKPHNLAKNVTVQ
jgi:glucosamine--fructose-6-phosphate aminotransferase (isomerizing)